MSVSRRRTTAVVGLSLLMAGILVALATSRQDDPGSAPGTQSVSTQDPVELLQAARTALQATGRVHVVGSTEENDTRYELDIRSRPQEQLCAGTVTGGGARLEFVFADSTAYVRGDHAFWELSLDVAGEDDDLDADAVLDYLDGRWVQGEMDSQQRAVITPFCEVDDLLSASTAGTEVEFAGRRILPGRTGRYLRFPHRGQTAIVAVDQQEPHLPFGLELADLQTGYVLTSVDFEYGGEVTIDEPDPEDTVTRNGPVFGI